MDTKAAKVADAGPQEPDHPPSADGPKEVPAPSSRHFPPFGALRAFDAVGRLGSIRKAARALARDHAVISRHIRGLEEWAGVPLLRRTSLGIELTDAGHAYHQQIMAAIDLIADASLKLTEPSNKETLRLRCMPAFALHWLSARLGEFEEKHPHLALDLRATERVAEIEDKNWDVDIRLVPEFVEPPNFNGLHFIELARVPIIAVASPDYLDSLGWNKLNQLTEATLLHEEDTHFWLAWLNAHGFTPHEPLGGPILWQGHLTLDAARNGRGVALTNPLVADADLESSVLVDVLAALGLPTQTQGVYGVTVRPDQRNSPVVVDFAAWLTDSLQANARGVL
ncbi:MAG: LysR substrate-binding domain-containing protein [Pseudomonadota bacterium]